ncbi:MAG TPA: ATP-binding cassette domain-containing protein [Desulfobacterales bacterium]|nr:ATP-binding cassette domain-containing protein [Desulfobacterales bacterium]
MSLIEIKNLKKYFEIKEGFILSRKKIFLRALDDVSIKIEEGKTHGIVGESGCGKTTLGKSMIRLIEPTSGDILYHGKSIMGLGKKEMLEWRQKLQIIFQDPFSSLDPRKRVKRIIGRPLEIHHLAHGREKEDIVNKLLGDVGLTSAFAEKYPHELSGGQRQRIAVARALVLNPQLIIADEPVTSLDVSLQAQILLLLKKIQAEKKISYAFISHDLSVVRYMSDDVSIMYLGKLVEEGETNEIYRNPCHPYTRALFSSILVPNPKKRKKRLALTGEVPSLINPPPGCRFHPRCPEMMARCKVEEPAMIEESPNHRVSCHLFNR